jgi:hypothetical protein
MVKENWSIEKEENEKKKKAEIRAARVTQYNILRTTPKFTVRSVTTTFVNETPYDVVTMENDDVYRGTRTLVQDVLLQMIYKDVDSILGISKVI